MVRRFDIRTPCRLSTPRRDMPGRQHILLALKLQRRAGVDVFTDGEYRRGSWQSDMAEGVLRLGVGRQLAYH